MFDSFRRALRKLRIQLRHINNADLVNAWQRWETLMIGLWFLVVLCSRQKKVHDLVFEILKKKNCSTFFCGDIFICSYVIHGNGNARDKCLCERSQFHRDASLFTTTQTRMINTGDSTCTSGLYHQRVTGTDLNNASSVLLNWIVMLHMRDQTSPLIDVYNSHVTKFTVAVSRVLPVLEGLRLDPL